MDKKTEQEIREGAEAAGKVDPRWVEALNRAAKKETVKRLDKKEEINVDKKN